MALFYLSATHAQTPPMGNATEVIGDVSKAVKKSTKDKKTKKDATKTEDMANASGEDCPPDPEVKDKNKKNDYIPYVEEDLPKIVKPTRYFFNVQFLILNKNGTTSFQEVPVPQINLRDEVGEIASARSITRAEVLALGDVKLREILMEKYESLGVAAADVVDNALLVNKLSIAKSDVEMYRMLDQEMSKVSYGRKVNFLANLLSYLNTGEISDKSSAKVTDKKMMAVIHQSILTGDPVPVGTSLQMHQLAVRYARAMGINEAFGVNYKSVGGGNRTLVLTHPDDPAKVIQLNYGAITENKGVTGAKALSHNSNRPDVGINLVVFNGKDEHAITLPSEQGGVLNTVTGGKDSDLGPNYKSEAQIKQAGVDTPYGTVRFFRGTTPMGNQSEIDGVAYNTKIDYNKVFYGEYAIAGFSSERPSEAGKVSNKGIYAKTAQGFNWKFYESHDLDLSTFGKFQARGALFCPSLKDAKCQMNSDYQLDLTTGIMGRYDIRGWKNFSTLSLQTQFVDGISVPVINLNHQSNYKLSSETIATIGGGVTRYNLGTGNYWTYNANAGVHAMKTGTSVKLDTSGRLTRDTPIWLPGAEHAASLIVQQSIFGDTLYIGVDGKQSFDVLENNYLGMNIGSSF